MKYNLSNVHEMKITIHEIVYFVKAFSFILLLCLKRALLSQKIYFLIH